MPHGTQAYLDESRYNHGYMFQDLSSFQGYTWEVTNDWSNVNGYFVYIQVYIAGHLGHLMEI